MAFAFNTYNNISNRQRSQTLQPIRDESERSRRLHLYFKTIHDHETKMISNYANVQNEPCGETLPYLLNHSHSRSHQYQHLHARSHSQHYYQACDPNYYNLTNTMIPGPTRSPIDDTPRRPLDNVTLMQVCNQLGNNLDSSPPLPPPRNYTVAGYSFCEGDHSRNRLLFKVPFGQRRYIRKTFCDPNTHITIPAGSQIVVLGVAEDRSKFTVCYNDHHHMDIPHQLTTTHRHRLD